MRTAVFYGFFPNTMRQRCMKAEKAAKLRKRVKGVILTREEECESMGRMWLTMAKDVDRKRTNESLCLSLGLYKSHRVLHVYVVTKRT